MTDVERIVAGDQAAAEALRLAKAHLEKMGWKYSPAEIGKTAGEILVALRARLEQDG